MYEVEEIPLELLRDNPNEKRRDFGDIEGLAKSIEERGLQYPIAVIKVENYFVIAHGHRRVRAFLYLNRKTIPSYIKKESTPEDIIIDLAVENLQRKDLLPVEKGETLLGLLSQSPVIKNIEDALGLISQIKKFDHVKKTGKFKEDDIIWAKKMLKTVGVSTTSSYSYVRLLLLPEKIKKIVVTSDGGSVPNGNIGVKAAYELTRINDPILQQELSEKIVNDKMKHKELKYMVDNIIDDNDSISRKSATGSCAKRTDDDEHKIVEIIEDLFNLSVKVENFRFKLPVVSEGIEKVRLKASLDRMKKVCFDVIHNINEILIDDLKEDDMLELVNTDFEMTVLSSNKCTLPVKISDILKINQGDTLLLRMEGIKRGIFGSIDIRHKIAMLDLIRMGFIDDYGIYRRL